MIILIVGCIIFGSIAWLWRNRWSAKRIHGFIALLYSAGAWFCSFWIGVWIQLDLMQAGTLGDVSRPLVNFSLGVGIFCYFILRKKEEEDAEIQKSVETKDVNPNT